MSNFFDEKTVFILDSYGLIYREYFAFISHPLTNKAGENISALFGFFRNLSTILKRYKPRYMVAAFDSRTPTFRHERYPEYKANREKTPDDLKAQFPWIEEVLHTLGIPLVRCDGFEADDVIATIAAQCEKEGRHCCVLSADKDLMQLTTENTHILKPDRTEIWAEVDMAGVEAEWGVPPEKLLDLLSLMGDTADNVPGVKGIGPKSAVKLLSEYGSLEGIYEHADEIKGAQGEKLRADRENAFLSKELITLRYDVPCAQTPEDFKTDHLNFKETAGELVRRELPAVAKQFMTLATENGENMGEAHSSRAAVKIEQQKEIRQNQGAYKAVTEHAELAAFVDALLASENREVALDTETDSLNTWTANLVGFSLSNKAGSGIYVPVILTDSLFAATIEKKFALEQIARLFNAPDCTIIMHNAKFDLQVLWPC